MSLGGSARGVPAIMAVAHTANFNLGRLKQLVFRAGVIIEGMETESIIRYSWETATKDAVLLWSLASAEFPYDHRRIQEEATLRVIEAVSTFSLNARRALECIPDRPSISLSQPRWLWERTAPGDKVTDLWTALNRVVHARRLDVGWERLPQKRSTIESGAIVVPYVQAETDRYPLAFIDVFALAHAFLYQALRLRHRQGTETPSDRIQ